MPLMKMTTGGRYTSIAPNYPGKKINMKHQLWGHHS